MAGRFVGPAAGWSRRAFVAAAVGGPLLVPWRLSGDDVVYDDAKLLPGDFTWHPERSPQGPVAVIVSLPEQLAHVYRNGIRIGVSTVSSGKPGHATPTGIFTILQKDKDHHSSTYNEASMPYTERLTWDGVALHAGGLPGYPSSHGCVHLPLAFAELLFGVTHMGSPVIIAGSASDPWDLVHPGVVLGGDAEGEMTAAVAKLSGKVAPQDWTDGAEYPVVTVLATGEDRRIALISDGATLVEGALTLVGDGPLGEHAFVLRDTDAGGMQWTGITWHPDPNHPADPDAAVVGRLQAGPDFRAAMAERMHPGMMLVVSDLAAHPDRRTGADFVIMASDVVDIPPPPERPSGAAVVAPG